MAGPGDAEQAGLEVEDGVGERDDLVVLEVEDPGVEGAQHRGRAGVEADGGAHRDPHLAHDGGRAQALAHHVADDQRDATLVDLDAVVPVAADLRVLGERAVGREQAEALEGGQPGRQQRLLERGRRVDHRLVGQRALQRLPALVGQTGEELGVLVGPAVVLVRPQREVGGLAGTERDRDQRDGAHLLGQLGAGQQPGQVGAVGGQHRPAAAAVGGHHRGEGVAGLARRPRRARAAGRRSWRCRRAPAPPGCR